MRGRSYTPSPPRGYGRRGRSPSPRGRYGGRGRDLPTSLLVRNLRHDCRQDDLRRPFGQFAGGVATVIEDVLLLDIPDPHLHVMPDLGPVAGIIIPLLNEGIIQDPYHPGREGIVKRGHTHGRVGRGRTHGLHHIMDQEAVVRAQLGVQAVAEAEAQSAASAEVPITTLRNQTELGLLPHELG
ncbi:Nucleotide-binding alpha-beta plait domain containing protein [Parasponia andersonii]|uniref:Nucleotide-binding alpha-beta plait domain containing protein n=1 Tax=Parasponia andersonii TaxID=3476 RepID=A0A2P5CVZ0_PARAD|nr:Nucleotide-binding alpha-beta plait domain containing protein [Parasponia andersonii]